MPNKTDLSRLVSLGALTPSEAVCLFALITIAMKQIDQNIAEELMPPCVELDAMRRVGVELTGMIDRQLSMLLRPAGRRQAPYPL